MGFTAFKKPIASIPPTTCSRVTADGSGHTQLLPNPTLLEDISQLIRLIANALEAHSVFFLIPAKHLPELKVPASGEAPLFPLTSHTLSPESLSKTELLISSGPLCWVSRTGRPLQITPFESDARVLGVYGKAVELKSLAAIPIPLPPLTIEELQEARGRTELSALGLSAFGSSAFGNHAAEKRGPNGVLVVDSLKSYSFTDQKIKLFSQLGGQLKRLLELHSTGATSFLVESGNKPERDSHESDLKATLRSLVERYEITGLSMISVSAGPALSDSHFRDLGERSTTWPSAKIEEKSGAKRASAEREAPSNWRSLFPSGRLLALSRKIEKVWQGACSDIVSELSAESSKTGTDSPHMVIHSSNSLVVVGDHLLARHLTAKIKSILSLHLKRELVHIIKDPRSAVFHELASQIFSFREKHVAGLLNRDNSSELASLEEEWISHALNQIREVSASQKSKHPGSRRAGNTLASRKSAPQFHRVQHQLEDIDANRAAPSPTQAEHAFRMPEMEGSSGAKLEDLQLHSGATLRTQERMRA